MYAAVDFRLTSHKNFIELLLFAYVQIPSPTLDL